MRCADRTAPACRRGTGFSLIEVLVALAIVGLVLGAAATVFGNGVRGQVAAADIDTALNLAEAKLAAAGITAPPAAGTITGAFGRFRWQVTTTPYEDKSTASDAAATQPPAIAFRLYRVAVAVAWRDGRRQRQVALSTLRLAPAPGDTAMNPR